MLHFELRMLGAKAVFVTSQVDLYLKFKICSSITSYTRIYVQTKHKMEFVNKSEKWVFISLTDKLDLLNLSIRIRYSYKIANVMLQKQNSIQSYIFFMHRYETCKVRMRRNMELESRKSQNFTQESFCCLFIGFFFQNYELI